MDKRGAYRTIIAAKQYIGWVFICGYSKNELENIDEQTLSTFKIYSKDLFLNFEKFIKAGLIIEVFKDGK